MQKEIEKKLDKSVIDYESMRPMWFYLDYFVANAWAEMKKESGLDVGMLTVSKDHLSRFYLFFKDDCIFEEYAQKVLKNKGSLGRLKKKVLKSKDKIVKRLENTDYRGLSDKGMIKLAEDYFKLANEVYKMAVYLRCIDRGVKVILDKRSDKEDIEKSISSSIKPSYFLKEKRELIRLATKIKRESLGLDSAQVINTLKSIHARYCWITCGNYDEKARSSDDYRNELMDIIKNLGKDLDTSDRIKPKLPLVNLAAESAYLKDEFKFFVNEVIFKSESLFKEISFRVKKPVEFLKDLFPHEVIALLNGSRTKAREGRYLLSGYDNKVSLLKNPDGLIKKYIKMDLSGNNELKGRIASKGFGKGFAKIVLGQKDFNKFQKGDILVVSNTTPNYIIIMKKAAAIIAEEGGLTAHVSVVSREFGIPCVVGIKNATDILKDGDIVEVDAERGVVKILKKK